jgi:hypothetical protein
MWKKDSWTGNGISYLEILCQLNEPGGCVFCMKSHHSSTEFWAEPWVVQVHLYFPYVVYICDTRCRCRIVTHPFCGESCNFSSYCCQQSSQAERPWHLDDVQNKLKKLYLSAFLFSRFVSNLRVIVCNSLYSVDAVLPLPWGVRIMFISVTNPAISWIWRKIIFLESPRPCLQEMCRVCKDFAKHLDVLLFCALTNVETAGCRISVSGTSMDSIP